MDQLSRRVGDWQGTVYMGRGPAGYMGRAPAGYVICPNVLYTRFQVTTDHHQFIVNSFVTPYHE